MRIDITLRGEKADRFKEVKAELAEELGYEPDRPEVVVLLCSTYDTDADIFWSE